MTTMERFLAKVKTGEGCWEWQGTLNSKGYGQFWDGKRTVMAHWFLLPKYPDRSKGEEGCHHCDNRRCVRPSHVFVGTRADNMNDCVRKGRHRGGNLDVARSRRSYSKGQDNHASKLTLEQAREIFFTPESRGVGAALARAYGVSETVICGIRNGSRWKGAFVALHEGKEK